MMTRGGFLAAAVGAVLAALGVRRGRTYWDWSELCEDMVFERQGVAHLAVTEPPEYIMIAGIVLEQATRGRSPWATIMRVEGDFVHIETWNCLVHYRIVDMLDTHDVVVARRDGPYEWAPPQGSQPVRNRYRELFADSFPGLTNDELDHFFRELL